jgi:hypothetical protein
MIEGSKMFMTDSGCIGVMIRGHLIRHEYMTLAIGIYRILGRNKSSYLPIYPTNVRTYSHSHGSGTYSIVTDLRPHGTVPVK